MSADSPLELSKVCDDLAWTHDTSTPHRPVTNDVFFHLRSVHDTLSDGECRGGWDADLFVTDLDDKEDSESMSDVHID